jgi:two-component system LytT family response regulator
MHKPYRVVVVDDEAIARSGIVRLLSHDAEVDVIADAESGARAIDIIVRERPDIVFLDVQMPEVDGFDVVRGIEGRAAPAIVFATAYDQFALRAFDVNASDYLLKPFTDERFLLALDRAKRAIEQKGQSARLVAWLDANQAPARILIRETGRSYAIPIADIDWIEGSDYYVKLRVAGKAHLHRETMASLERRLPPDRFFRVHRSAIVNLSRVREIRHSASGQSVVVLTDDTRIRMTRGRRPALEAAMEASVL